MINRTHNLSLRLNPNSQLLAKAPKLFMDWEAVSSEGINYCKSLLKIPRMPSIKDIATITDYDL